MRPMRRLCHLVILYDKAGVPTPTVTPTILEIQIGGKVLPLGPQSQEILRRASTLRADGLRIQYGIALLSQSCANVSRRGYSGGGKRYSHGLEVICLIL